MSQPLGMLQRSPKQTIQNFQLPWNIYSYMMNEEALFQNLIFEVQVDKSFGYFQMDLTQVKGPPLRL